MFERDGKSLRMMRDSTQPEYSDVTGSPALGRFINHSSLHPNVKSLVQDINGVPHILYKALRDILAGEELLYDYADKREGLPEWFKTTIHNCPCGCEKYRRNKRIQFSPPSKSSRVCKTGVDMPLNLAPKVMSGLAIKFDRVIIENGAADFESLKNSAEAVAAEMRSFRKRNSPRAFSWHIMPRKRSMTKRHQSLACYASPSALPQDDPALLTPMPS